MDYEQGLIALKQLATGTDWYANFLLYEARLRENLANERLYGADEQSRSTRARIVDQLNQLAYNHLRQSFNDMCRSIAVHSSITATRDRPERVDTSVSPNTDDINPARTAAFIVYSYKDKRYLEELHVHLAHYMHKDAINVWDESRIRPGAKRHEEIEKALRVAKVAILLVSADFLASDFIMKNQLPPLLAAAEKEGATILPVLLRPSTFADSDLAQYNPVNSLKPLSSMSREKRETEWVHVAELVRNELVAVASYKGVNDGRHQP